MEESIRYTLANRPDALAGAMEEAVRFLEAHAVPADTSFRVQLALEEIATNIIKYGYDDTAPHAIVVTLAVRPETVSLRLEDDGRPFDPSAAPRPDLTIPIEQRRIGGLGLHLVRHMAARFAYRREGASNILDIEFARA